MITLMGMFLSTGEDGLLSISLTPSSMNPSMRLRTTHSEIVSIWLRWTLTMESEELEIRRSMSAKSLRLINLKSAVAIGAFSFYKCKNLLSVEFGDRLEIISGCAFALCISLQHLKLPSIITIGLSAFSDCTKLIDVELSERIESIWARAFDHCQSLQRIAIPLKEALLRESICQVMLQTSLTSAILATINVVGGMQSHD